MCLPIIITTSTVLIDVVVVDVDPGDVDVVVVVVVALFSDKLCVGSDNELVFKVVLCWA